MKDKIKQIKNEFSFGEVVKIHCIGDYQIIESNDENKNSSFYPYINFERIGISYDSLDKALTGVICYKHDGINSQANKYLWKMIK